MKCPTGYTTRQQGSTIIGDCSLPVCVPGQHLSATTNECVECELGYYQPEEQQTECLPCPTDTTTNRRGATDAQECTNICKVITKILFSVKRHQTINMNNEKISFPSSSIVRY